AWLGHDVRPRLYRGRGRPDTPNGPAATSPITRRGPGGFRPAGAFRPGDDCGKRVKASILARGLRVRLVPQGPEAVWASTTATTTAVRGPPSSGRSPTGARSASG